MKVLGFLAFTSALATMTGCATTAPPAKTATPLLSTAVTTTSAETPAAPSGPTTEKTDATPAASPPAPAAAAPVAAEPEPMPTACAAEQSIKDGQACLPPGTFVKKLCESAYPDVALSMFSKGTPWTRVWLAGDVEAWSASGGFTARQELAFDEEVIVLSRHAAPSAGGIVISGNTSFDVLRWDGSCVSVLEGELTTKRPPAPKAATMSWNRLEDATKRALLTSHKVKSSRDALDKACTGDKDACTRAEQTFTGAIAHAVRTGAPALPMPTRRP